MQATRPSCLRTRGSAPSRPARKLALPVQAAGKTSTSSTKAPAKKGKGEQPGFRWDGSMMRWVRDDRFAAMETVVIETKTGSSYTIWPVVHTQLDNAGIKSVTPEEALKMQSQGWTIVDVRIDGDFQKNHAAGAVNVPLFRFVQGTAIWDNVKKVVMASFAMKATERDPDYVGTIQRKFKKGQKIILMCAIGGTLKTGVNLRPDKYPNGIEDPDRSFGRESRGLKAAYELVQGGWNSSNLTFVEGGFQQWKYRGLPLEQGP